METLRFALQLVKRRARLRCPLKITILTRSPQHDRHGSALLRVVDVDRQEAALVIMSVELIAAADREHARAEHIGEAVQDPRRVAPIREHQANLSAKPRRRSAIARSITPPFEVRRPPSKAAVIFLA
jgi:hypothetical protein